MAERTVTRVEIEYSDGEVTRLVGPEAKRWDETVTNQGIHAWNRGQRIDPFQWEFVRTNCEHCNGHMRLFYGPSEYAKDNPVCPYCGPGAKALREKYTQADWNNATFAKETQLPYDEWLIERWKEDFRKSRERGR